MKKTLSLILISIFSINSFAQNISKEIPLKHRFDNFYLKGRFILNNKRILAVYDFEKEDELRLDLLDENFNEVKSKVIPKNENSYLYSFQVEGDFLYITNSFKKSKKNPGIKMSKVSLDGTFSTSKHTLTKTYSIITDASNKFCYYNDFVTGELVKYNLETKEKINIKFNSGTDKDMGFSGIISFQNESDILISTSKNNDDMDLDSYGIALYDEKGQEKASFNCLENNNYKAKIYYSNNQGEIITSGNFIKDPTINDVFHYRNAKVAAKKRKFDGIYVRTLNSEKPIERYYDYSAFPNLFKVINSDKKDAKLIGEFTYVMEDIIKIGEEYVSIGTINENKYQFTESRGGNLSTVFTGTSLKYILIYGFNSDGEITWEQVLSPNWNYTRSKYDRIYDVAEAGDLITIKKIDNKIICHFSLIDKIHYFEIIDKKISNYKQTEYEFKIGSNRLKDKEAKDLDQYKDSFYWYDNFYCSYLNGFTENHTLFNRTEFKK